MFDSFSNEEELMDRFEATSKSRLDGCVWKEEALEQPLTHHARAAVNLKYNQEGTLLASVCKYIFFRYVSFPSFSNSFALKSAFHPLLAFSFPKKSGGQKGPYLRYNNWQTENSLGRGAYFGIKRLCLGE